MSNGRTLSVNVSVVKMGIFVIYILTKTILGERFNSPQQPDYFVSFSQEITLESL